MPSLLELKKVLHKDDKRITEYFEKTKRVHGNLLFFKVLGLCIVCTLAYFMILFNGIQSVCNCIGFGYPTYQSPEPCDFRKSYSSACSWPDWHFEMNSSSFGKAFPSHCFSRKRIALKRTKNTINKLNSLERKKATNWYTTSAITSATSSLQDILSDTSSTRTALPVSHCAISTPASHISHLPRSKMTESEAVATPAATPKKAKAAEPKKTKTAPNHSKVSEMVNTAISTLKERSGSSVKAIKKYVGTHYKVGVEKLSFIKKYLKNAVASGTLVHMKSKGVSGSFRMATGTKGKATKTKSATPKAKKAAKPAAAKKAAATKMSNAKSPKKSKAAKPKAAKKYAAKKRRK